MTRIHKALRQVLHYAVRAKLIDENPAALVPNPEPKRTEVQTFTLDELEAVAAELSPVTRLAPAGGVDPSRSMLIGRPLATQAFLHRPIDGKVRPVRRAKPGRTASNRFLVVEG
jgi:hypothetical protein